MLQPYLFAAFLIVLLSIGPCRSQPLTKQQHQFALEAQHLSRPAPTIKIPIPAAFVEEYNNLNEFENYYRKIVNQVLDEAVQDIIEAIPETYYTIHELQFVGREYCKVPYNDIIQLVEYHLNNKARYALLAAIRPLIDHYYQQHTADLSILELNHFMGQQLSIILNNQQVSQRLVRQIYYKKPTTHWMHTLWKLMTDKSYGEARQHEVVESMALQAWLQSWLTDIEFAITDDFDLKLFSLPLAL